MSKYNYFEMCRKIFGSSYKWDEKLQQEVMYSRKDLLDKLLEQQEHIAMLNVYIQRLENDREILLNKCYNCQTLRRNIENNIVEKISQHLREPAKQSEKDFWKDIVDIRYKHDISIPNNFCKSIERLCKKQEKEISNAKEDNN
ncbi:MAG: hypothetical protein ACI4PF_00110 [Christensenellales bacterium]